MSLATCKACGKEVSKNAEKCPHCGEPLKAKSVGCGTAIVLIVLVMVAFNLFTPDKPKAPARPLTAAEQRTQEIEKQFSAWNGAHRDLERRVKTALKDPDSYEHIETKYVDNGAKGISVLMKYRAKNSFGGYVVESIIASYDNAGNLTEGPISLDK